jgi:hypothetical protein
LHVSEHQAEQTSGEPGAVSAGSAVPPSSDASSPPPAVPTQAAAEVASPDLVPGQGAAADADLTKVEAPRVEAGRPEAPKPEAAPAEAPRVPGKLMIMSAGDRAWDHRDAAPEAESEPGSAMFGKRRLSAMAAVVALATVAGALGGALAMSGLSHLSGAEVAATDNTALETSVARIDADILALKASVEHIARTSTAQFNKTSDRLDKVEKAQAEPAAKLAKLSEAVEKLHAAPQPAPVPVAAAPAVQKDVTGSITPPAPAAPAAAPKVEVGRLPTVEGWVLRDVANGGALIEGRQGMYEVYAGDPVPGLGRVDAIRRQDGRWVVVTTKGLVVAR